MSKLIEEYHITNAEWQIMKVVWANKEVTSKFVAEVLCDAMEWKKTTIKTLLNRLLEKKVLEKKEVGNKYIYYTNLTSEEISKKETLDVVNKICNIKVGELLENVIKDCELSINDIENIEKVLKNKKKNAPQKIKCKCLPGQCNCKEHNHSYEEKKLI